MTEAHRVLTFNPCPSSLSPRHLRAASPRAVGLVRFQEESEPAEYVELLAEQMLPTTRYEELHILKGPYVMEKWDPELMEVRVGGYIVIIWT